MRRIVVVITLLFLFVSTLMAQTEMAVTQTDKIKQGQVVFKAQKLDDRYFVSLRVNEAAQKSFTVKAIKIIFEPSGTVPLVTFGSNCTDDEKTIFLLGQKPLSSIETPTFADFSPFVSLEYPSSIRKDTLVKIEYLIEKDGVVSTKLAAASGLDTTDFIAFSVTPTQEESAQLGRTPEQGLPYTFCCGANPPTCVHCSTPVGTCCPSCDVHYANCGEIKCPPPPC